MKRLIAVAALALASLFPLQAPAANTWGPDLSDLWWNNYESGWGANIAHQGDTIFLTLFVYGQDRKPKWYVGPAVKSQGNFEPFSFTGDLFETAGPWINGLFNPDEVTMRRVGYATIVYPDSGQLRLSYTVDNVSNTKWLERQTFREANLTGTYIGATAGSTSSGCAAIPGPYRERAGYDYAIQGMGGLMSGTGPSRAEIADDAPGGGPQKVGVAVADLFTGMYATIAILAALRHRDLTVPNRPSPSSRRTHSSVRRSRTTSSTA